MTDDITNGVVTQDLPFPFNVQYLTSRLVPELEADWGLPSSP